MNNILKKSPYTFQTISCGLLAIFLGLILGGCAAGGGEIEITPLIPEEQSLEIGVSENIEEVECEFGNQNDGMPEVRAECGYLTVPEDRSDPDGRKIRLPFTVIKGAGAGAPADPLVVLFTNPSSPRGFARQLGFFLNDLRAGRDMILLEQRGVGDSEPNLECPDVERLLEQNEQENATGEAITQELLDGFAACKQQKIGEGVNLDAYTTAESAADLEDLRQALGIKEWNLFGVSYGANLALELMDRYPGTVRSAILESPVLLDIFSNADQAANAQASLDAFFKSCADDSQCNKAFPNLETTFYQQVDQLNASPVTLAITDTRQGSRYNLEMDGDRLLEYTLATLDGSYVGTLSELPRAIYNLSLGKADYLANMIGNDFGFGPESQVSSGMQLNIYCRANPQAQASSGQPDSGVRPQVWEYYLQEAETFQGLCEAWGVEAGSGSGGEYQSSVPSLVIAGEFSNTTPARIAEQAAGFLPRSTLVVFNGAGGFPTGSQNWADCAQKIEMQLLAQPGLELDTSCAEEVMKLLWITIP